MENIITKEFYTNAVVKFGKVLYRGYAYDDAGNKKRIHGKVNYKPTMYLESEEETEYKSLFGKALKPKKFDTITLAKEFVKSYESVMPIYGYATNRLEYNFLADSFPQVLSVGINQVSVGIVDIETTTKHGKIDPINAPEQITLITYEDFNSKRLVTFGWKPTITENFVLCKDEKHLLTSFVKHVIENDPDIISGWNVKFFDIVYIIKRIEILLGKEYAEKLSPFGTIELKEEDVKGKTVQSYTIVGRGILDMLELYKKFTFVKRDNYKLETVAMVELGVGKLENAYGSFQDWQDLGWDNFVEYNQIDVVRVRQLEEKLGLISLALSLSYLTKCNYSDVFSPVKYWECYILASLSYENTFCAIKRKETSADHLDGAYVMEPKPGFYDWIVSIDGASLYPSIIRGLNMSPETIISKDPNINIESFLDGSSKYSGENFTVAANGAMFSNAVEGIMCRLVGNVLTGRSDAKKAMLVAKQEYENTKDPQFKKVVDLQNTLQQAYKVAANSLFGICGNAGFIFFDHRIAEGITHTGQYILKYIGSHVNMRMNEFFKTQNHQYLFYGDTDSLYFSFGNIVEKYYKGKTDLQITDALDVLMEQHLRKFINEATDKIAENQNYYKKTIVFKREAIGSGGFWLAKKKYALKVFNNEGVVYKDGDYKILGLEVVRSSTPEMARKALKECVIHVINKDIDSLRIVKEKTHAQFKTFPTAQIAFPRGVNNLEHYSDETTIYSKGTPIAVRGALLHNYFVDSMNLENLYQPIEEGGKVLFTYLKEPNHFKEDVIAFVDKIPTEFNLEKYVDREKQFEKVFMAPLEGIMKAVGWQLEPTSDLDDFFS